VHLERHPAALIFLRSNELAKKSRTLFVCFPPFRNIQDGAHVLSQLACLVEDRMTHAVDMSDRSIRAKDSKGPLEGTSVGRRPVKRLNRRCSIVWVNQLSSGL
jgi:hypothetical protein